MFKNDDPLKKLQYQLQKGISISFTWICMLNEWRQLPLNPKHLGGGGVHIL